MTKICRLQSKNRIVNKVLAAVIIFVMIAVYSMPLHAYAAFRYEHDPMDNPKAAKDIIVDENAVYGYSPNPSSTRLGEYASYDWSDETLVANAKAERIQYHERNEELYQIIRDMSAAGNSTEEIARAASKRRNEIRLEAYKDDPERLEKLKKSNLETYGHEEGPLPDELFEKYGSWQTVIDKALSSNPGMDACLGLYDLYYDTYGISESTGTPDSGEMSESTYEVKTGDCLWSIAAKLLNDGRRWTEIYELNRDIIDDSYVIYTGQVLKIPGGSAESPKSSDAGGAGTSTYEVKSGDCLWRIAQHQLNDGCRWTEIYELNRDIIDESYVIYTGQELIIPAA